MKKIYSILAVLFMAVLCVSCDKAKTIKTGISDVHFGVKGGSDTIFVSADGVWSYVAPEWMDVSKKGNVLICSTEQNTSGKTLTGELIITGDESAKASISATQTDKCTYLATTPGNIFFDKNGGTENVNIKTDGIAVKVECNENGITCKSDGEIINLVVPPLQGASRQFVVKLKCDAMIYELPVKQQGTVCHTCNGVGKIKCPKCNGTYRTNQTCPECNGYGFSYCCGYTGKASCPTNHTGGPTAEVVCPVCKGTGY